MDQPQKRRIVLCMGPDCNLNGRAQCFYDRLKGLLGYPGLLSSEIEGIKWETATCLNHCEEGPNLVIYPDKQWFHELDEATLEEIIAAYIAVHNKP